jgi:hypothetical protein
MTKYPSIETVYVRDKATNILAFGTIRLPEITCIRNWTISEKIDGTNIRAIVTASGIEVRGRTDAAQIPPVLKDAVLGALPAHEKLLSYFREYGGRVDEEGWSVTFYGEGYGPGIQKGASYSNEKRFRVFDLMLGDKTWVDDGEMRRVCRELGIPTAPHLGYAQRLPQTYDELKAWIPQSVVAVEDRDADGVEAEGIVAKPEHVLLDKYGDRVVWKLTLREWSKLRSKGVDA